MSAVKFDPEEFLTIVRELGTAGGEAALRVAVSRVYYGMFLIARELLKVSTQNGAVHGEVQQKLATKEWNVGNDLKEMRRLRNLADYTLDPDEEDTDWESNWLNADVMAEYMLPVLRKLPPGYP